MLFIINEVTFKSIELNLYFCNSSFLRVLSKFLSSELKRKLNLNQKRILTLVINNLYLLTRYLDDLKLHLTELDLVEKLFNLIRALASQNESENREIILNSLYCVGNLVDDCQIESMNAHELEFMIAKLLDELEAIVDQIEWNELRKLNPRISNALTGNLTVLVRFAVNPNTKKLIFMKQVLLRRVILRYL